METLLSKLGRLSSKCTVDSSPDIPKYLKACLVYQYLMGRSTLKAVLSSNCTILRQICSTSCGRCTMACRSSSLRPNITLTCLRYFKHPPTDDFLTISAVLRLSTKYFVHHLRERCLLRLEKDWPASLIGWDKRELEATDETGHYAPRDVCAHPVLLIELAYELSLEQFLPAAFYDLSRYGPSKIVCGTMPPVPEYPTSKEEDKRETPTYLSTELLTQTFQGREHCQAFMAKFINSTSHRTPSEDCLYIHNEEPSRPCIESFYFIALNLLRSIGGVACGRDADPLYTLVQAMDMLSRTDFSDGNSRDQSNPSRCALRMCAICKSEFAETCVDARNLLWKLLPVWFGLADSVDEEGELMEEAYN